MRFAVTLFILLCVFPPCSMAQPELERLPTGRSLKLLVRDYLVADAAQRVEMRRDLEARYEPLPTGRKLAKLRKTLLATAAKVGPKLSFQRRNYWFGKDEEKQGKYLVSGRSKTLFIGLHGGGVGSGEAESIAGALTGGRRTWIYPEVLKKTAHGWTTAGTEEFVIELVRAAKRSGKIDPNRIYISGHSMGGYGTWTLGAHHADVFAGGAAFAGAPTSVRSANTGNIGDVDAGVLPNWFNSRLFVFQSTDDRQVPPEANQYAIQALKQWKEEYPDGFDFRYQEVHDRGHAPPKEGYGPGLAWLEERVRNPHPRTVIWEPSLTWKRHFFWIYWEKPQIGVTLKVALKEGNEIHIEVLDGDPVWEGLSFFLPPQCFDLEQAVQVFVDGEALKKVMPIRSLATLLQTLPRHDSHLLFDARIDL